MRAMPLKTAIRHAGGWSILIFFVVLLTLIFSFLGTICCAVLAGMMIGPSRFARWQALLVSLIFPGVIFTVLRSSRAELLGKQIAMLSLLCFGAFWLTYAVVAVVVVYERKEQAAAKARRLQQAAEAARGGLLAVADPGVRAEPAASGTPARSLGRLTLELLQGRWSFQNNGGGRPPEQKVLEVDHEQFVLRVSQADGEVSFVARAQMQPCPPGAPEDSAFRPAPLEPNADTLVSI